MDTVNKEIIEKKVYEDNGHHDKYASNSKGNAALTLGIIGTAGVALGAASLWGRGRGFGIAGGGMPENVNINTNGAPAGAMVASGYAPTAFQAWEKGCEEALALTNTIWGLKVNTMTQAAAARNTDVAEKFSLWKSQVDSDFGLYKSQVDGDFGLYKVSRDLYDTMNDKLNNAAFGLYKNQRDGFDCLANRLCQLEKEVAVNSAIRPYQDKLIQCDIEKAYNAAINHADRLDCRSIKGIVTLPSTPTVTGFPNACRCNSEFGAA